MTRKPVANTKGMPLSGAVSMIAVLALLAGCGGAAGPGGSTSVMRKADPAVCGADRLAALVGGPVTLLPGDELSGPVRVIRPGQPVTDDFNPARLNLQLDGSDSITSLTCG